MSTHLFTSVDTGLGVPELMVHRVITREAKLAAYNSTRDQHATQVVTAALAGLGGQAPLRHLLDEIAQRGPSVDEFTTLEMIPVAVHAVSHAVDLRA